MCQWWVKALSMFNNKIGCTTNKLFLNPTVWLISLVPPTTYETNSSITKWANTNVKRWYVNSTVSSICFPMFPFTIENKDHQPDEISPWGPLRSRTTGTAQRCCRTWRPPVGNAVVKGRGPLCINSCWPSTKDDDHQPGWTWFLTTWVPNRTLIGVLDQPSRLGIVMTCHGCDMMVRMVQWYMMMLQNDGSQWSR